MPRIRKHSVTRGRTRVLGTLRLPTSVSVQKRLPTCSQRRRQSSVPDDRGLQTPGLGHRSALLRDYCARTNDLQLHRSRLERARAEVLFERPYRPPNALIMSPSVRDILAETSCNVTSRPRH